MQVEIYGGDFGGPTGPGTYQLDGSNYADCGLCVVGRTNCTQSGGCEKPFYASKVLMKSTLSQLILTVSIATIKDAVSTK